MKEGSGRGVTVAIGGLADREVGRNSFGMERRRGMSGGDGER